MIEKEGKLIFEDKLVELAFVTTLTNFKNVVTIFKNALEQISDFQLTVDVNLKVNNIETKEKEKDKDKQTKKK